MKVNCNDLDTFSALKYTIDFSGIYRRRYMKTYLIAGNSLWDNQQRSSRKRERSTTNRTKWFKTVGVS